MTSPGNPRELFSPFLPSTFNLPEEEDRQKEWLGSTLSDFSDVVNAKKIGAYTQDTSTQNGEIWIYDTTRKVRNGFQAILRIPSFVSGTYPLPISDVNPEFVITHVWGSASKPCSAVGENDGDYFSFYSEGNANIQFTMSDTEIVITAAGMADYQGFIIIEFLRMGT